jgi:hypothetical protein
VVRACRSLGDASVRQHDGLPQDERTDSDGDRVGDSAGECSLSETYGISIDDASDVSRESVVAATMVAGAIQEK